MASMYELGKSVVNAAVEKIKEVAPLPAEKDGSLATTSLGKGTGDSRAAVARQIIAGAPCVVDVRDGERHKNDLIKCAIEARYDVDSLAKEHNVDPTVLRSVLAYQMKQSGLTTEELTKASCKTNCGEDVDPVWSKPLSESMNQDLGFDLPNGHAIAVDLRRRFDLFGRVPGKTKEDQYKFAVADLMLEPSFTEKGIASVVPERLLRFGGSQAHLRPVQRAQLKAAEKEYVRQGGEDGGVCLKSECDSMMRDQYGISPLSREAKVNSWELVSRELDRKVVEEVNSIFTPPPRK